jgi:hypothetical protein
MSHLTFEPYIPIALWVPLALAAAALVMTYAVASRLRLSGLRRVGAIGLMTVAVALPLSILLNPTWIERVPPPAGKPLLTILVDGTVSMATADGTGGENRFESARKITERVNHSLQDRFDVEVKTFATGLTPATLESLRTPALDGESTDIAAAIDGALADRPQGQALLLLSDGIHNAGGGAARLRASAEKAKAMSTPIYTTTLGQPTGVRDLELTLNLPEELAFVAQDVPITALLRQRGALARSGRLIVRQNDTVVERRDVTLATDGAREEVLSVQQKKPGLYRYDIELEPAAGEVTDVNNHATLMLRVIDEPVRVLLLEGKPYWDTKFLVRTLAADSSVQLSSIVRMAEGRFLERHVSRPKTDEAATAPEPDKEAPASADTDVSEKEAAPAVRNEQWSIKTDGKVLEDAASLANYQVIILGRDAEVFLSETALVQLKKWLAQGDGSLVCFRGPPSSQLSQRLGELMPVRWSPARESRFRVRLTESGQSMGWLPGSVENDTLSDLPSLASVMRAERPKPLAVVLATGSSGAGGDASNDPVISFQPVGNGRVVVVEGAGMWRWAFLPAQFQQHDAVYGRLWRSLTRWLVANAGLLPSQQMSLRSDKVIFSNTSVATGTLLLRSAEAPPPQIEIVGEAIERPQRVTPIPVEETAAGQFRVVFGKLPEGRYHASVVGAGEKESGARTAFDVRGNYVERLDVAARADVMKLIAQRSGGAPLDGANPEALAEKFHEHRSAHVPERTLRITAWDRWWVLLAVFGAWALSWGLRRQSGLI